MTTLRCIPVVLRTNLVRQCKAMFGISHLKLLLNSSHPWGGSFFVGIFGGQVDGGEVPV